jgi:hypothetical protein
MHLLPAADGTRRCRRKTHCAPRTACVCICAANIMCRTQHLRQNNLWHTQHTRQNPCPPALMLAIPLAAALALNACTTAAPAAIYVVNLALSYSIATSTRQCNQAALYNLYNLQLPVQCAYHAVACNHTIFFSAEALGCTHPPQPCWGLLQCVHTGVPVTLLQ